MRKSTIWLSVLFCGAMVSTLAQSVSAEDWPIFRGPQQDGICRETGLLKAWPEGGPKLAWKTTGLGEGYSSVTVVGNVLYTQGHKDGKQSVTALDVSKNGELIWQKDFAPVSFGGSGFPGSRATPTIDCDRIYTTGLQGEVVCMDIKNGRVIWKKDFIKDFGGKRPNWGFCESVLVDGPWVICTPGGKQNTLVALDKTNGDKVWGAAVGDAASYSSIVKAKIDGVEQYINLMDGGIISVRAKDGKFLWRYDAPAAKGKPNCSSVIVSGNSVFGASGYNNGGGRADIKRTGDEFKADEVFFCKEMQNHHGGMILYNGMIYGSSNVKNRLTCLDFNNGDIKWTDSSPGKCSLLMAEGLLYCRDEKGPISLVEATPDGFKLKGRFNQPDRSDKNSWAYLVIANGMMYVRDQDVLLCYDVRAEK